jgi:sporadic carbohydrate cluster 2OG-Fe(II) oxygenase
MFKYNFNRHQHQTLSKKFEKNGYIIFDLGGRKKKLDLIKKFIQKTTVLLLKKDQIKIKSREKKIFNNLHKYLPKNKLNSFRMRLYEILNSKKWFLKNYFEIAKDELELICGNELVMQRKINLSIQFPEDDSSLLPVHSDVWSGCSPFEVVLWVPLESVSKSKSMFILSNEENNNYYKNFYKYSDSEELQKKIDKKIKWLSIKYGQGLIFVHQLMHGNKINRTNETRWSFNCRFKSVMSPYDKKDIAETFLPIFLRPATKFGLNYEDPKTKK